MKKNESKLLLYRLMEIQSRMEDTTGEISSLSEGLLRTIRGGTGYANTGCVNTSCTTSNDGCTNHACESGTNGLCTNHACGSN